MYVLILIVILAFGLRPALAQTAAPSAPVPAAAPSAPAAGVPVAASTSTSDGAATSTDSPAASSSGQAPSSADQSTPEAAPPATGKVPIPKYNMPPRGLLTIGWTNWNDTGNRQTFLRNGTPPQQFSIDELRYAPYTGEGNLGEIDLRDPFQADSRDLAQLAIDGGYTQVTAQLTHSEFYNDSTSPLPPSERSEQDLFMRQRIAHWLSLSSRYSFLQQDDTFDQQDPMQTLHQRTRYNDLMLSGVAAGGTVDLTFSNWSYFDRTQLTDNTNVKRWEAGYDHMLGAQDLSAKYDYLAVATAGAPSGHVQIMSLADALHLGDATTAAVSVRRDTLNLPVVQNSYVRQQQSINASLAHTWSYWNAAIAFQRRSAEEINSESTGVVKPQWQTVEGNINGDLGRGWRFSANGRSQNLWNDTPLSTTIPESLLWSSRQYGQVRLDAVANQFQTYFDASYNRTTDNSTSSQVRESIYDAGADIQATDQLDVYMDYTNDFWNATDNQIGGPTLGEFAPSDRVFTLGGNWTPSVTTSVSAAYSGFWSSALNPTSLPSVSTAGGFLTLAIEQQLGHGRRLGLVAAPWAYRDAAASTMDYNATVLRVNYSTPF